MINKEQIAPILISWIFFCTLLNAQVAPEIDTILSQLPATSNISVFIYDPAGDDTLYAKNINRPMIPASNMKIVTTAAALSMYGKDFELSTKLMVTDTLLNDGIINGNLYLKGFGNPKFSEAEMRAFIDTLTSLGIKKITGSIIADDSYFDTVFSERTVYVEGETELALPPVSALIFERNTISLSLLTPDNIGATLDYSYSPTYKFIDMNMTARSVRFRSSPRVTYRFDGNKLHIRASGGSNYKTGQQNYLLYIENPALYCALALKENLEKSGISVALNPRLEETPPNAIELASASVQIKSLLADINKNSDNFMAESLFKTIGAEYCGCAGNKQNASTSVIQFLEESGLQTDSIKIYDGSGISRRNRLTTNAVVHLLTQIYKDEKYFEEYYASLSIAGKDGTLGKRMPDININFHSKTGSLYGVSSIAGYLKTKDNDLTVISIITSFSEKGNFYHKQIEDKIIEAVCRKK